MENVASRNLLTVRLNSPHTLDNEGISVFRSLLSKKRGGIGSALVKKLEIFRLQRTVQEITVPSTPSKEALSFWLARGYHYVFPEDSNIGRQIQINEC